MKQLWLLVLVCLLGLAVVAEEVQLPPLEELLEPAQGSSEVGPNVEAFLRNDEELRKNGFDIKDEPIIKKLKLKKNKQFFRAEVTYATLTKEATLKLFGYIAVNGSNAPVVTGFERQDRELTGRQAMAQATGSKKKKKGVVGHRITRKTEVRTTEEVVEEITKKEIDQQAEKVGAFADSEEKSKGKANPNAPFVFRMTNHTFCTVRMHFYDYNGRAMQFAWKIGPGESKVVFDPLYLHYLMDPTFKKGKLSWKTEYYYFGFAARELESASSVEKEREGFCRTKPVFIKSGKYEFDPLEVAEKGELNLNIYASWFPNTRTIKVANHSKTASKKLRYKTENGYSTPICLDPMRRMFLVPGIDSSTFHYEIANCGSNNWIKSSIYIGKSDLFKLHSDDASKYKYSFHHNRGFFWNQFQDWMDKDSAPEIRM